MTQLEQRLQEELPNLNQLMQQCQHKQKDGNIEIVKFVTEVTQKLDKYRPIIPPNPGSSPDLITRHVNDQELTHLFGELAMETTPQVNPPLPPKRNNSPASPAIDVRIISSFTRNKTRVATVGIDKACLWYLDGTDISLVKSNGKVIQDINTDFNMYDAAVSKSGDLLVTEWRGKKVKKFIGNNTFTNIYAAEYGYKTLGITVTEKGMFWLGCIRRRTAR
ncbi:hypothetical protein KUTeg_023480 [Tegillarca granosa]|uniref:Uncharacterized protein n=1 Tax=Tegillarca granosa TaxID=220873 RepID=A0ABQ9E2R0_TEGGR|nr:hypothetical protein KUTeg_023480 [Tegillarca granosa]